MRIRSIDHVQLAMPAGRESEARAFYEALLGVPEVPKPARLAQRGGCWFERGEIKIHLGIDPEFRPARKAHPAFLVEDLPALIVVLKSAGHDVTVDEQQVYVHDHFGNRIELIAAVV